jgi:hypothetical protein
LEQNSVADQAVSQQLRGVRPNSIAIAYPRYQWPKVNGVASVFYVIDPDSDPNATPNIDAAISIFNSDFTGIIQWVPWTAANGPNYVDINLNANDTSGQCEAIEGYQAMPAQPMNGSTSCTVSTLLHEMGHVIGLWHEQSRPDRDSYITVNYNNVIKGSWSNFAIATDNEQLLAPYDYASVMQYPAFAFSRNGGPVIETIPAGIPLNGTEGLPVPAQADYSAGDKESIERLYGAAPTTVTITSNPVGMTVIVDDEAYTTPQQFQWQLNSTHSLNTFTGVITMVGDVDNTTTTGTFYYTFGRWNDTTQQNRIITVSPGDGSPAFPLSSPMVATYSANFIQLVPYLGGISPGGSSGAISVSPQPQSYGGTPNKFLVARQLATLTATPASGWSFYQFNNYPVPLPGGPGANPKSFYVPDTGSTAETTAYFSSTPIYTVDVQPDSFSSNLGVMVDGQFTYTPKNFSSTYDTSWNFGSQHTLNIASSQYPYSSNSRYVFSNWSDGGSQNHTLTVPGASQTYVATLTPEFAPATNFNYPPCGGSGTLSPASQTNDGFYPTGQLLTYSATPAQGWAFAGWTYDLTGTTSPSTLTASDETLVFANFNTVNTPLTLTSLSPSTVSAGSVGFTLTLNGTGFAPGSIVTINGQSRAVTYINSTTLQVQLTAADVASPAAIQVAVENFPKGWTGCGVFGYQTFIVGGSGLAQSQTITFPTITGTQTAGTNLPLSATASSGLPVSFVSTTPAVCTIAGTTASLLIAGTCTIQASQPGNTAYFPAPTVSQSFTVSPAFIAQTITFLPITGVEYAGTSLALAATATSGLPVSFASTTLAVCTVSGNTASLLTAGTCTIQATQSGNSVYSAAPAVSQSLTVSPALKTQTITFPAITGIQYTGTNLTLSASASSGLPVSFASTTPAVCTVSGSTASLLTAGTCTIQATQAGNSAYSAAPAVSQNFTVSPALKAQTITFPAITGTQYTGTNLALSATASSGLAVSLASTTPAVCTLSGSAASLLTAGTCTIQATQAGNSVYSAAPAVSQSFTVSPALKAQTITFPAITGTHYAGTNLALSATASSGLAVSLASTTPAVCTVSGSTASLLTAGTCTIQATQAGNSVYSAATAVSQSFTVSPALKAQTITFPAITGTHYAGTNLALSATASSGLAVSLASTTPAVCTVSGSTASLLTAGTCTIQATQTGNSVYSAASAVSQGFTVSPALKAQTITFPAITTYATATTKLALNATASSGLIVTFASTTPSVCTISGATASFLIYGVCTLQAFQPGNTVYLPAPTVSQSFQVHHLSQTINFPPITGTELASSKLTLKVTASSGLPVTITSTTPSICTVSGATASLRIAGTCTLKATQGGNAVYNPPSSVSRSFTVSKAKQTISFATIPTQVEGTKLTLHATASSGLAVSFNSATTKVCTVSGTTASLLTTGTCSITASQGGNNAYYAAASIAHSFTVNP